VCERQRGKNIYPRKSIILNNIGKMSYLVDIREPNIENSEEGIKYFFTPWHRLWRCTEKREMKKYV
jgi:hypothetical protein